MIVIKIDWNKIDMDRLYVGEKTEYLNLVLKENRDGVDQYGNLGFVIQDQTKEERDAKVRAPIIGNWREIGLKTTGPSRPEQPDDRGARQRRNTPPPRQRPGIPTRPPPRLPTRPAPGTHGRSPEPPREPKYGDPNVPDADPNY